MTTVRVLAAGIDTIHASAAGTLRAGLKEELVDLRVRAGEDGLAVDLGANPEGFILQPHGWRGYAIWLRSARIELMLGAADPFPPVFIQWHSPFIHAYGVRNAVPMVEDWLDHAVMEARAPLGVSRLDLYCDLQGWKPRVGDLDRFVCRAMRRTLFEVPRQTHLVGRRFSGFTFGKGDVVCRVYDKTLQMAGRGENWQEEVWTARDQELPVWRVEFQFRRRALRRFGLETLEQALDSRQSLWVYATEWLSLREPDADGNRSRWVEAPSWRAIRDARLGAPCSPVVPIRRREASQERLIRGFLGYASSLGAIGPDQELDQVLRWAGALSARHLRETGCDFRELVEAKRSRTVAERLFRLQRQARDGVAG
ncbi:MAG: hypothetical protein ACRENX_01580 [Candidatus Dormibacteria bacterium]